MNKAKIRQELARVGISVKEIWFTMEGYRFELVLSMSKGTGWEELDTIPIEGFDLFNKRILSPYRIKITFVPNCRKEFARYVKEYINAYGGTKEVALTELERVLKQVNNISAINELYVYKKESK